MHASRGRYHFGVRFASAVWELPPEQAQRHLAQLTRTGLVAWEQDPFELGGQRSPLWRLRPLVYRLLEGGTAPVGRGPLAW
ncbi:MAG: hypothetical protein U9Q70_00705 [Chloroflexota bacterium]|nr:hypothetical protein [Chloroflexota bacterium]